MQLGVTMQSMIELGQDKWFAAFVDDPPLLGIDNIVQLCVVTVKPLGEIDKWSIGELQRVLRTVLYYLFEDSWLLFDDHHLSARTQRTNDQAMCEDRWLLFDNHHLSAQTQRTNDQAMCEDSWLLFDKHHLSSQTQRANDQALCEGICHNQGKCHRDTSGKDRVGRQGLHAIKATLYNNGQGREETSSEEDSPMARGSQSCQSCQSSQGRVKVISTRYCKDMLVRWADCLASTK